MSNSNINSKAANATLQIEECISDFCKIEKIVAKYIYTKYINVNANANANANANTINTNSISIETANTKSTQTSIPIPILISAKHNIYSLKVKNDANYKRYLDTIFQKARVGIITQQASLTNELNNITVADNVLDDMIDDIKQNKPYAKQIITCRSRFMRNSVKSFPDIMRCNFIIKNKNKLHRCGYKIISVNCEYCSLHELMPNMYWDRYCSLLENAD